MYIENLVFKGGGVLGMSYSGALEILESRGILSNIKGLAGTSAGAAVATMVAIGYSSKEIRTHLENTDFKKFGDGRNFIGILRKYGIYKGEYLLNWLETLIEQKTGIKNLTFKQLHAIAEKNLKIFACDLDLSSLKEFSVEKTPNVVVAEALRASMSIPLLFHAYKFKDSNPNDHIYIDGGVIYNFPITAFPTTSKTLGLYLKTDSNDTGLEYNNIFKYVKRLFKTLLKGQDVDFFKNYQNTTHTIILSNLGISTTNFSITAAQKQALYQSAKFATENFLNQNNEFLLSAEAS